MHAYDIVMLVVLVACTVFGAWKGLAWQVASLSSIVVSYLVALNFSDELAPHISAQAPWNRFIAMLVLYVGTSLLIWLGFRVVASAIDRVKLKEFDRQLGALVGAAKGGLLCLAITFFAVTLSTAARGAVLQSRSGYYIAVLIDKADPVIPVEFKEVVQPYLDRLEKGLDPNYTDDPAALPPTVITGRSRSTAEHNGTGGKVPRDAPGQSINLDQLRAMVDQLEQIASSGGTQHDLAHALEPQQWEWLLTTLPDLILEADRSNPDQPPAEAASDDPIQRARQLIQNSPEVRQIIEELRSGEVQSASGPGSTRR